MISFARPKPAPNHRARRLLRPPTPAVLPRASPHVVVYHPIPAPAPAREPSTRWGKTEASGLDALGAPAGVGLPHVGGGLDGGDELEADVGEADDADDAAADDEPEAFAEDEAADEDVDCGC